MLRRVDRLFHRYQRTRDPRALGAVFDRTAPELLRVARHLTADPHRADDLVQATFLTAIERAEQYDPRRPVLPWLLAILANRAREWYRADRRRRDTGQAVEDLATAAADDAATRELAAVCDRALDALPQPYRRVLILHLRHGLSSAEIARAMEQPASTVRNQVARGMNLLRRGLPVWTAGATVAATAGDLGAVRAEVLARAEGVVAAGAAAAASIPLFAGGLLVGQKLLLPSFVVLVLVALGGGVWIVQGGGAAGPSETAASRAAVVARGSGPEAPAPGDGASRELLRGPRAASGSVRVALVIRGSGAPAARCRCRLGGPEGKEIGDRVTGEDGLASFEDLLPGRYTVTVQRGEGRELATAAFVVEAGEVTEQRLEVPAPWSIRGIVVDRRGVPVAGARIQAAAYGEVARTVARSAADGSFEVRELGEQQGIWALAEGRQPSANSSPEARAGTAEVRLVIGDPGAKLRGVVLDESGARAAGALVAIGIGRETRAPFRQHELHRLTAEDGSFAVDWLPPGRHFVGALPESGDEARSSYRWVEVAVGADASVELHLGDGARLAGQVRSAVGGEPLARVKVSAHLRGLTGLQGFESRSVVTDAEGRYVLGGLMEGTHSLTARRGRMRTQGKLVIRRLAENRWDARIAAGGSVRVRLLGPDGAPIPRRMVVLGHPDPAHTWVNVASGYTDAAGRSRFENLEPIEYTVRGLVQGFTIQAFSRTGVVPALEEGEEFVVRLRPEEMPSARLRGRVVDARGVPVPDAKVTMTQVGVLGGGGTHEFALSPDGRFTTDRLPPVEVRIHARAAGTQAYVTTRHQLVQGRDHDLGDIVLPDPSGLEVRLAAADGAAIQDPVLRLVRKGSDWPGGDQLRPDEVSGVHGVHGLSPGDYVLRFFAANAIPETVDVTLPAGGVRKLTLAIARGRPVVFELRCGAVAPGAPAMLEASLTIVDASSGRRLVHERLFGHFDDFANRIERVELALPPGAYRARAREYGKKETEVAIEVPAAGAVGPFVLDLR